MCGAALMALHYGPHWKLTPDPAAKLGVFCTNAAVRSPLFNIFSEVLGTAVLVLVAARHLLARRSATGPAPGLAPWLVASLVWGIGLSLGGTTGYAINPARDLGPRLVHCAAAHPRQGRIELGLCADSHRRRPCWRGAGWSVAALRTLVVEKSITSRSAGSPESRIRSKGVRMKVLDRILASILVLGGLVHAIGSLSRLPPLTDHAALGTERVSVFVACRSYQYVRSSRPGDNPLAWIAFAGSLALAISAFTLRSDWQCIRRARLDHWAHGARVGWLQSWTALRTREHQA